MNETMRQLIKMNARGETKKTNSVHIGKVVDIDDHNFSNIHEFNLPYSERGGHFGVIGTTGIGKTKLLAHMLCQDIRTGNNVFVCDPKGDVFLMSAIIQAAVESGRLADLMMVSPIYPEYSMMVDPLAYYYLSDELVDHVVSGIKSDDEYFINVASEVCTAVVTGLIAQDAAINMRTTMNFFDIKQRVDYDSLCALGESLNALITHPLANVREMADEATLNIRQIRSSPQDFFAKVSSSLRTVLTALVSSSTGKIIGHAKTNEFVRRFENGEGVILICNTGNLLARRTAYIIGRVMISMIQSMVGRFFASGLKVKRPLCIYMDEGHNLLYQGIEELFNKSRAASIWLHFFTQSMAQIEAAVGPPIMQSIIDNISTWVFMRVNQNDTAKYIEESSPIRTVFKNIINIGDAKLSMSLREEDEYAIRADRGVKLKPRYFFMRSGGKFYKGIVPMVKDPYMRVEFPLINTSGPTENHDEQLENITKGKGAKQAC
jgi:type IV secretory pathway TraG/TraD family ATPase VirD4